MKESLANIEKQSKNKADIIKAQASGKDSTVDVLKEQRKQLRSEGRKLQKEMRSYNDIYSPSERSQILRNKRMESSYDVDMARAAVSDKVAASLKVSSSGSASSSNSTKSGNNKIRYNVETGNYAARSSKMEKQLSVYSGQDTENVAKATIALKTYNEELGNFSTKQLLSYAAVIGETTQEGMSSVGTSLNAIFSRMGNIKLSRLKDYQNGGEDLSNVETVLKGVGISLRDTDGEFKNFGDVLDDTAARWSDFGTVQQRAVAQAFAGTNHMNDFMVLMQQYSKAQEYMQTASDASGTSMEKYGAYTDSFEGKLEGLKSTFESLSNTVVNSDFLKGTIDTGTQALEIFDKVTNSLGVINTAAIGLGIFQGKNNSGESTWDSPHAFFKTTYAA